MTYPDPPRPDNAAQAHAMQEALREKLIIADDFSQFGTIAGVDVGYDNARGLAHASVVVMSFPKLEIIERAAAFAPADFPYIPGLLAFREIPAILAALRLLRSQPDLLMVDGHGIAHPRRMGIAAHLGVFINQPAIGVAKSCLVGSFTEPGPRKGERSPLMHKQEQIGVVLRSRDNVQPLFISPGHRVAMQSAVDITLQCLTSYRLPEPTRLADKYSKCKPGALL